MRTGVDGIPSKTTQALVPLGCHRSPGDVVARSLRRRKRMGPVEFSKLRGKLGLVFVCFVIIITGSPQGT